MSIKGSRVLLACGLVASLVLTFSGTARAAEGVSTPGFGTAPPNVVRAVEMGVAGNAPMTVFQPGDPDPPDGIKEWWTSLGRRALPALLAELSPGARGASLARRGRTLRALSYLVQPFDRRRLRDLYARGYRDVLFLLLLLEDPNVPRYVAEALDRGERYAALATAAFERPHAVVDRAVVRAIEQGPARMGPALGWMLHYAQARGVTAALPALDQWARRLEEPAAPGTSIQREMLMARLPPPAWDRDPLEHTWKRDRPPVWRAARQRAWDASWRLDATLLTCGALDPAMAIHGVRAALGSSEALQAIMERGRQLRAGAEEGRKEEVCYEVCWALEGLVDAPMPSGESGWTELANWWQAEAHKLRYDPDRRAWVIP